MKLSELHKQLSKDSQYRDAYERIGDSVLVAIHFTAARKAARFNRTELAAELKLKIDDITRIEDYFDFSDQRAVSLIADRLEGHLESFGVNPKVFFIEGARYADLKKVKEPTERRPIKWSAKDFDSSAGADRINRLRSEALTTDQASILDRVLKGTTTGRDAVRELIQIGVIQTRAELLVSIATSK